MSIKPTIDPGFGEKYYGKSKRVINPDGTFNVNRKGTDFNLTDGYQLLVNMKWSKFLSLVISFYLLVNLSFAILYYAVGVEHLHGARTDSPLHAFLSCYFFSAQTFTTVGYGGIAPYGIVTSFIATLEAVMGVMSFAIATGVLYGRFSRPNTRLLYSKHAVITNHNGKRALMFRVANKRSNVMIEVECRLMLVMNDPATLNRQYYDLKVERSFIYFFALNWTIVHPLDEDSPLFGKTEEELRELEAEVLILIKGYDDSFSQVVHSRYSYRFHEFKWGAKFKRAYSIADDGIVTMALDHLDDTEPVELLPLESLPEKVKADA